MGGLFLFVGSFLFIVLIIDKADVIRIWGKQVYPIFFVLVRGSSGRDGSKVRGASHDHFGSNDISVQFRR